MNEADVLKTIINNLSTSSFIGDDCAKITPEFKDKPLFITQDTLAEDVHFSMTYTTPYQLGIKAVSVNVSDLCAALSKPQFLTISLSMPPNISEIFVDEFYKGVNHACKKYGCFVVGGDITGADKIIISVCAIGQQICDTNVGRANAQTGDLVVICGQAGGSAIGLAELLNNKNAQSEFTKIHHTPEPAIYETEELTKLNIPRIASMDTSDGIADAIYKISAASKLALEIDGEKLPTLNNFDPKCKELKLNREDVLLFGGEDFGLLLTMPPNFAKQLPEKLFTIIGKVTNSNESFVSFKDKKIIIDEELIKEKTFNHFKKEKN